MRPNNTIIKIVGRPVAKITEKEHNMIFKIVDEYGNKDKVALRRKLLALLNYNKTRIVIPEIEKMKNNAKKITVYEF